MNPHPGQNSLTIAALGAQRKSRMLKAGADPEARDSNHLTGLIWAGRKGSIEVATVLLSGGANLDGEDWRKRTSLSHAVAYKRHEFVAFLLERGAAPNPLDIHGWTPLDIASSNQDERMVSLLKIHGGRSGKNGA